MTRKNIGGHLGFAGLIGLAAGQLAFAADPQASTLAIRSIFVDSNKQVVVEFDARPGMFPAVPHVLDLPGPNHRIVLDFTDANVDRATMPSVADLSTSVNKSLTYVRAIRYSEIAHAATPTARVVIDLPESLKVKPRVVKLEESSVTIDIGADLQTLGPSVGRLAEAQPTVKTLPEMAAAQAGKDRTSADMVAAPPAEANLAAKAPQTEASMAGGNVTSALPLSNQSQGNLSQGNQAPANVQPWDWLAETSGGVDRQKTGGLELKPTITSGGNGDIAAAKETRGISGAASPVAATSGDTQATPLPATPVVPVANDQSTGVAPGASVPQAVPAVPAGNEQSTSVAPGASVTPATSGAPVTQVVPAVPAVNEQPTSVAPGASVTPATSGAPVTQAAPPVPAVNEQPTSVAPATPAAPVTQAAPAINEQPTGGASLAPVSPTATVTPTVPAVNEQPNAASVAPPANGQPTSTTPVVVPVKSDTAGVVDMKASNAEAVKHYNNAVVLHLSGKLQDAIAEYQSAVTANPNLAEAYSNLGLIYNQQHNYAQALAEFHKALAINPKDAITYNGIGAAMRAERDLDGAIKNWETAVQLDPHLATAHYNLGTAYEIQKNYDKAVSSYQEAVKNDYRLGEAYYRMGLIMERKHRNDEAAEQFSQALKVSGNAEYSEDARQRLSYLTNSKKKSVEKK